MTGLKAQIDNPGARARTGWVEAFGIPKTLLPEGPVPLVGHVVGEPTRYVGWRHTHSTGTHHIYTTEMECQEGERTIDVVDIVTDQWHIDGGIRWPLDKPFEYADGLAEGGMSTGFVGELTIPRADGIATIPLPWSRMGRVLTTDQVTVWRGRRPWNYSIVDWQIVCYSRHPVARLQSVVTCDELDDLPGINGNDISCKSATLKYGAEMISEWDKALDIPISGGGGQWEAKWTVPGEKITRCTAPFIFDGALVFDGASAADRDGPLRAVLLAESVDGHVPVLGVAPRWDGSEEQSDALAVELAAYQSGATGKSWLSEGRFGARDNPNAPGDDYQFGAVQVPELYARGGVRMLGWMLSDARLDLGKRCLHHRKPGEDHLMWEWTEDSQTETWEDKPDSRVTPALAMLGPELPGKNSFDFKTYDSEHDEDIAASLLGMTGDFVLGYLLNNRFQMKLGYRRRYPSSPWAGVPRATGRFSKQTLATGLALDERDKARDCNEAVLRVAVYESTGWKGPSDAILKPLLKMGRYYPDKPAIGPWQEGIGVMGMFANWMEFRYEWHSEFVRDLEQVMRDSAEMNMRIATVRYVPDPSGMFYIDANGDGQLADGNVDPADRVSPSQVGWPYKIPYSDSSDPAVVAAVIASEPPSFNELNSYWPLASAHVAITFLSPGTLRTKALAIYEWSQTVGSPALARWTAMKPVMR